MIYIYIYISILGDSFESLNFFFVDGKNILHHGNCVNSIRNNNKYYSTV